MTSNKLPAVLTFAPPQASISMERALNQVYDLLTRLQEVAEAVGEAAPEEIQASLDDVELMLSAIER